MDKHQLMIYIFPVITIIVILMFLFLRPGSTGFAVLGQSIDTEVQLSINSAVRGNFIVEVTLDDDVANMTVKDFIEKSVRQESDGDFTTYFVNLHEFGLGRVESKEEYVLKVRLLDGRKVVSEGEQIVTAS